jgi:hypothetical protein
MIAKILMCILMIALINVVCIVRVYIIAKIRGRGFLWTMLISNVICLIVAVLYIVGVIGA